MIVALIVINNANYRRIALSGRYVHSEYRFAERVSWVIEQCVIAYGTHRESCHDDAESVCAYA